MSRHARRETQGEQDWRPERYPPPGDSLPPDRYRPAAEPGAVARPLDPDYPAPGDVPPERWDEPAWDAEPWDAEPWDASPEEPWEQPGAEHPSAPLSPGGYQRPAGHKVPGRYEPPGRRDPSRGYEPPGRRDPSRGYEPPRRHGPPGGSDWPDPAKETLAPLPPPSGPAGRERYPEAPAGYHDHPVRYPGEVGAYPDDQPRDRGAGGGNPPGPRPGGRGRGGRGAPDYAVAEPGHRGYGGYVERPEASGAGGAHDPGAYLAADDWYGPAEDEPDWAEDRRDGGLLPGLDHRRPGGPAAPGRRGGPGGSATGRKRRRRGRTVVLVLLSVFVIFAAVVGGVGYHYYRTYFNPPDFSGPGTGTVVVQIKPGENATQVGEQLAALGVVASARAFSNAAKANPRGNALEPGYFKVHKQMKASLALALLLSPASRVQTKVTVPEGFRVSRIIQLLGQDTGNLQGYQQAIAHPAALGLPSYAKGTVEGYLFPATYEVQPKTPPVQVLRDMVAQFKQEAAGIGLVAAAAQAQEGPGDVITVASLLEAEGKRPQDYAKIAEVIYNRLNATPPMHLQLDTTVLYGMDLKDSKAPFSTNFPSPYNTYLHGGLPPGPIDNPGKTAIEAALHPAHGNLLYFLTINSRTGQTLFFSNAQQFDAAVAKYGSSGGGSGTGHG